jgi:Cu-processing system permease protein
MKQITRFVLGDILRNRILLIYGLLLALFSWTVLGLEDNSSKGLLSLLNISLLIVPLFALLFSTIYLYNSQEFIELLVSQPIHRKTLWRSLFWGLGISLVAVYLLGMGIPLLVTEPNALGITLLGTGILITLIFTALGVFSAVLARDKARGIGLAVLIWLFFAFLFDGLVLFLLYQFSDYPIEKFMIGITMLSPIDLSRILILLQLDVSALMGFTGALFKSFFGTQTGMMVSLFVLLLWVLLPFYFSLKTFTNKDL